MLAVSFVAGVARIACFAGECRLIVNNVGQLQLHSFMRARHARVLATPPRSLSWAHHFVAGLHKHALCVPIRRCWVSSRLGARWFVRIHVSQLLSLRHATAELQGVLLQQLRATSYLCLYWNTLMIISPLIGAPRAVA